MWVFDTTGITDLMKVWHCRAVVTTSAHLHSTDCELRFRQVKILFTRCCRVCYDKSLWLSSWLNIRLNLLSSVNNSVELSYSQVFKSLIFDFILCSNMRKLSLRNLLQHNSDANFQYFHKLGSSCRSVLGTLSNIYNEAFCENQACN